MLCYMFFMPITYNYSSRHLYFNGTHTRNHIPSRYFYSGVTERDFHLSFLSSHCQGIMLYKFSIFVSVIQQEFIISHFVAVFVRVNDTESVLASHCPYMFVSTLSEYHIMSRYFYIIDARNPYSISRYIAVFLYQYMLCRDFLISKNNVNILDCRQRDTIMFFAIATDFSVKNKKCVLLIQHNFYNHSTFGLTEHRIVL